MKHHALLLFSEKAAKFEIIVCCKLEDGALRVKNIFSFFFNQNICCGFSTNAKNDG